MNPWRSQLLRSFVYALAALALLGALVHVPAVQRPLVCWLSNWATEASGLQVDLEGIAIRWWKGRVALDGVSVQNREGEALADLEALEIGGVVRVGNTWHVSQIAAHSGHVDLPRWVDWAEQQPASTEPVQLPSLAIHQLNITELHLTLPPAFAGGEAELSVRGGTAKVNGPAGEAGFEAIDLCWGAGQTAAFTRPAGSIAASGLTAHFAEDTLHAEIGSLEGLGWAIHGHLRWTGGPWPVGATDLHWQYDAASGSAFWERVLPPAVAPWTQLPTGGRVEVGDHRVQLSSAYVSKAVSIEEPFAFTWEDGADWPVANGALRVHLDAARTLPGLDTLGIPWPFIASWTGPTAEVALAGGWLRPASVRLVAAGSKTLLELELGEAWTRANGRIREVPLATAGRLESAEFQADAPEGLLKLADWNWTIDAALRGNAALPERVEARGAVLWQEEAVRGDVRTSGRGLPADLAFEAQWTPGQTQAALTGQLNGLQPKGRPWQLHAGIAGSWQLVDADSTAAQLSLRNMVLLDGGRPTTFERMDAFFHLGRERAELRWESDLGTGQVAASTDTEDWLTWWQAMEGRRPAPAMPALEADVQFRRFGPIAQLLQWPVHLADGTRLTAAIRPGMVEARLASEACGVADWTVGGFQLVVDGWGADIFANASAESVQLEDELIAQSCALDLHGDSLWAADLEWLGWGEQPTRFRAEAGQNHGDWHVWLYEASVPWLTERLELATVPARLSWSPGSATPWALSGLHWETPGARLDIEGHLGNQGEANVRVDLELDSLPKWGALEAWPVDLAFAQASVEVCNILEAPMLSTSGHVEGVQWGEGGLGRFEWHADGDRGGLVAAWKALEGPTTLLSGNGFIPLDASAAWSHEVRIAALPLEWLNPLMPDGTVALSGPVSGWAAVGGAFAAPQVDGWLQVDSARAHIDYLGVDVALSGAAELQPDLIALDRWTIWDDAGHPAWLTGTILHQTYADWNFDLSLDANAQPFHLMDLSRNDNDLFYGQGFVRGDANVSGYANNLRMEARLRTEKGTTFALPLDAASDARYADFIVFKQKEVVVEPEVQDLSRMRMDLALDITEEATARIIFDEALGDEITGITQGALNLTIDDFKRFKMTGQLEVLQGGYLFTLQNVINKQFQVEPGGTVTWYGDPYAAEIDLNALYSVRTGLDPLLPLEPELPGRSKVELNMALKGNLMRPEIGFDIAVPEVNTRLQALVESALINEEELNRQVMGILVLQQFLSPDPTAAVGTTGLQERSTEFLASQVGFWLSQMTREVDVGLDYGTDATSGEQALAVALSAQLFDDRLHMEGAVGTNHLFGGTTEDLQVQDVRIRYDLPPDGMFQLTGYSTTNPAVTGQTGTSTQGVGVLMQSEFNSFGELWRRIFGRRPD